MLWAMRMIFNIMIYKCSTQLIYRQEVLETKGLLTIRAAHKSCRFFTLVSLLGPVTSAKDLSLTSNGVTVRRCITNFEPSVSNQLFNAGMAKEHQRHNFWFSDLAKTKGTFIQSERRRFFLCDSFFQFRHTLQALLL